MRIATLAALCAGALSLTPLVAAQTYPATLAGVNERPMANASPATGNVRATLSGTQLVVTGSFSGLTGTYAASHIHTGTGTESGPVIIPLSPTVNADQYGGTFTASANTYTLTAAQVTALNANGLYVNIHSSVFGGGEIRGQLIAGGFAINEVLVSTAGTDTEFIEISGTPGASLAGLTVLVLEGDQSSSGATKLGPIDQVITLTGTIPADGYWFAASPAAVTAYPGAGAPDQAISDNSFENGTETILLVTGFSGANGDDLDTNDDGVLDVMPWTAIVDGIALVDNNINDTPPDAAYFPVRLGPDGTNLPAGAYRSGNGSGAFTVLEFAVPAPSATPGTANPGRNTSTGEAPESGLSLDVANPVRGTAAVRFSTEQAGDATLALYDVLGRKVATLAEGASAGVRTATLGTAGLAPGVYVLRLTAGTDVLTRTLTVVR